MREGKDEKKLKAFLQNMADLLKDSSDQELEEHARDVTRMLRKDASSIAFIDEALDELVGIGPDEALLEEDICPD